MNVRLFRPVRAASLILAAAITLGSNAMAANSTVFNEKDVCSGVVEQDIPVVVSDLVTGTAKGIGTASVSGVNVRENPTMDADVVTTLAEGEQVVVLSKDGDWYRISLSGSDGFVYKDYMTVEEEGTADLGYAMIKEDGVNVRTSPDTDGETVSSLTSEDAITIIGMVDGWYQVEVDGVEGYIRSDLVDPTAEVPAEKIFDYAVVDVKSANIRSEPSEDAGVVDKLYDGSLCTLVAQVGDWYQIQYGDTTGYILATLTNTTNDSSDGSTSLETYNEVVARQAAEAEAAAAAAAKKAAEEKAAAAAAAASAKASTSSSGSSGSSSSSSSSSGSSSSSSGSSGSGASSSSGSSSSYVEPSYNSTSSSSIVDVAKQYMGVPYVWGGTSPSGFDCSGFTQYVFRQCGYSLSRTAAAQYNNGSSVSYSNLQAGDLVFFANTYATSGISHVGIYIGGGQFIHAASGGVKISSLSESYYSSRYYGACRVA